MQKISLNDEKIITEILIEKKRLPKIKPRSRKFPHHNMIHVTVKKTLAFKTTHSSGFEIYFEGVCFILTGIRGFVAVFIASHFTYIKT